VNEIALFLPCFNEALRLKIQSILNFIHEQDHLIDFYFIDDGSKDSTSDIIKDNLVNNKNSFLIKLTHNLGKGNAIRDGILKVYSKPYQYYGFVDADLDIPLNQVIKLYGQLENSNYLMAITSRNLYHNFNFRRVRSFSSIAMVNIANNIIQFQPKIKDTQCGCKLFKREVVEICFENEFISEWLFDIEIFLRFKKNIIDSRRNICEVPIKDLGESAKSNFEFGQNFKILRQLFKINAYYN
jgi:hypothetical protein